MCINYKITFLLQQTINIYVHLVVVAKHAMKTNFNSKELLTTELTELKTLELYIFIYIYIYIL